MTILLTGGTGKTSLHLASLLSNASIPVLLTSRRGSSASSTHQTVQFNWTDDTTWNNPFTTSPDISAIYLLSGDLSDPAPILNVFIDFAIEKGVERFVVCSGSSCEYGGPFHGKIWQKLDESKVEFAVLRPSWFMEPGHGHFETIIHHNKLFTACADGKIPWISAADIAKVAFHALTDEKPHNRAYRILGPDLLTYDEVAEKLSDHLGKEITHVKLSPEQRTRGMMDAGVPEAMAKFLTGLEIMAAEGREAWQGNDVELVTGGKATSFDEFVEANKQVWN
ncbi:NAD(P)-binding protein [Aureobasidium sp. EXF-8845]|nr:NAD(P)-binding protein [Aureobasidium sp. EXF-8845]KAI4855776.1 NAD(P)-binding protein [Aureobasidium sp. EXF-8846]